MIKQNKSDVSVNRNRAFVFAENILWNNRQEKMSSKGHQFQRFPADWGRIGLFTRNYSNGNNFITLEFAKTRKAQLKRELSEDYFDIQVYG